MNSMFNGSKLLAAGLCGVVLAGCNAVENVQEAPSTTLPTTTVLLAGTINGLGATRSIVIVNNGDNDTGIGAVAADPVTPIPTTVGSNSSSTPFSFGALPEGSPYNVTVRTNPYGKTCIVTNGSGVLSRAAPPQVTINCGPSSVPRFNLTVTLATAFSNSAGAKVRLKTEEAIYEATPAPGATSVTFTSVLFNGAGAGAPNPSPIFAYTVSALNTVSGVTNKCPVTNPTNAGANPTGNVTNPSVAACSFTIGGSLNYSTPQGGTAQPLGAGGLTVQLRDVQGNVQASQDIAAGTVLPANFTFNDTGTSTAKQFQSNASAVYDVVVSKQPTGQTCVVGDGGFVSLFVTGNNNPSNVTATGTTPTGATAPTAGTRLTVFCRNKPVAAANILSGTFRLTKVGAHIRTITVTKTRTGAATSTITTATVASDGNPLNPGVKPVVSLWHPFDNTTSNTASNAFLTFFDDGTFLYGQHNVSSQIEHGFYEYDSVAKTLRFTMHTDTNNSTTFPAGAFNSPATNAGLFGTGPANTPGISAAPGAFTFTTAPAAPAAQRHQAMCNVQITTTYPRVIKGSFGGPVLCGTAIPAQPTAPAAPADPAIPAATATAPTTTTATASAIIQLDWDLTEPRSVSGQITGAWITQDHREFWVYESLTYYGFHAGVNGGAANLQSACFTLEDATVSSSFLTRRGSNTGCYAWNNPPPTFAYSLSGNEAVDTSPGATVAPGFVGRMPGGGSAFDGRSPSPTYFSVAPVATWFSALPPNFVEYFPSTSLSWCSTPSTAGIPAEVLGVRATLNNEPVDSPIVPVLNKPLFFCRQ